MTYCTIIKKLFMGGLEAHPTRKYQLCGTGILPVLKNISCVEQASCLFLKISV
ncbi:hypothetical protein [Microcoleus sp. B13-B6]|uniref:hypothetical protein n=1 Tax=Microcoleus sp. B13-B6 TaxID=2818652 RepID=UPI002FD6726F